MDTMNSDEEIFQMSEMELEDEFGSQKQVVEEIKVVLDKDFSKELLLATNYECWMGHTNFNITPKIKKTLDSVAGVEIMKSAPDTIL